MVVREALLARRVESLAQAREVLAQGVPPAAGVVARFCLTKQAIRQGDAKPVALLAQLIEDSGGAKAPASACAAAAILAVDAQARDLHELYCEKFPLTGYDGNPALWSFASFLRDRFHRHALLKANYPPRGYIINLGGTPPDVPLPVMELKTLDGKTLRVPDDTNGKLTLLVGPLTFVKSPPMNIAMIDVNYFFGGVQRHVRSVDRTRLAAWLRAAYPINTLNVYYGYFDPPYGSLPSAETVNGDLAWNKAKKVFGAGEGTYWRYYGQAYDIGGFMRGLSWGSGSRVASGPTGDWSPGSWDPDSNYGDWYGGHENGHSYGRAHVQGAPYAGPGGCGDEAGPDGCAMAGGIRSTGRCARDSQRGMSGMQWLYSLLVMLTAPFVTGYVLWRSLRDPGWRERFSERFGYGTQLDRPSLWVHAASFGEMQASAPLVKALREEYPGLPLVITTTTPIGAARARALFEGADVRFWPFDLPGAVRRFVARVRPRVAVILETELWPNLYRECERRGVPMVIASARMAERSVKRYRRLRALMQAVFSPVIIPIGAQSEADAARFVTVGADPARVHVTGNLKFDFELPQSVAERGQR